MYGAFKLQGTPKLIITDGAGTLFDPGSSLPAYAFQRAFETKGIELPFEIAMKDMGKNKKQHIQLMLNEEYIDTQFQNIFKRKANQEDITNIYEIFKPMLYEVAYKTEEIKGVKDAAYWLKHNNIPLIMTTGYDRRMVNETKKTLPWLNDVLTTSFTSSEVMLGRPHPGMMMHARHFCGIKQPNETVKVGDTRVDIETADKGFTPGVFVLSGSIKTKEKAEQYNQEFKRNHLILPSLTEVIEYTVDGTLEKRINNLIQ